MEERHIDRKFRIKTTGLREWPKQTRHYNRYEATPYAALDTLFKVYKFNKGDHVVDFGCGRGRVSFYIHHHFHVPVQGIEVHEQTYQEALDNKSYYREVAGHIQAPIHFGYGLAEHYEVKATDNRFYFFNPFSVQVFKQVVHNILQSVKEHPRSVDIILYYPTAEYKSFLKKSTSFKPLNKVRVPGAVDKKEKFIIYRFQPDR